MSLLALWLATSVASSHAGTLSTTTAGGNGSSGALFEVYAANNLTISDLTSYSYSATSGCSYLIYYTTSTMSSVLYTPSAWTLVGSPKPGSYMKRLLLIFCCALMGITSCEKENTAPSNDVTGHEYFPVYEGFERYYHVDSIAWDNFTATVDTFSYDVKEVIGETFADNEGRPTQKLYRYLQDSATGNWVIWKVWSMNNLTTRAEQTEDNMRYVKLIFPPVLNEKWNGNAYNTNGLLKYKITDMSASETVGNLTFYSVLTVTQQDEDNLSERHLDEERYAANIGLYYRKNIHQKKVFPTDDIESGYIYSEILTGYSPIPLQHASPQLPD